MRFPDNDRASLDAISNTLLTSASGHTATLGSLATITELPPQTEIHRENLQREVSVTARTEGTDLGSAIQGVQKAVAALHVPPSIRVEYGGTYQQQQKSFHDFVFVLALAIVLVFIVLLFEFRTFAAPLAILASALLSTSGVFIALLITGTTFNVSSFMGLVMVVGIVAKNGILLLDADERIPADRRFGRNRHAAGQPAPSAAHCDDRPCDHGGNASAGLRPGRRVADAAAAGHRSHRRNPDLNGAVADHHPGGSLLSKPQRIEHLNLDCHPEPAVRRSAGEDLTMRVKRHGRGEDLARCRLHR